ncbi:MAG TPA: pyridoxamine 5'-phosphate oxidase family protein [Candidatus Saccharimonadales bacterium]
MSNVHNEARDFLKSHTLGVLSTVSEDSKPWGSAIYYAVGEHLDVYFLTRTSSRKYQNTLENSNVALTITDDAQQMTIQLEGTVDEVTKRSEIDEAFSKLAAIHAPGVHTWAPPVSKLHDGESVVLKISPEIMQFADFRGDAASSSKPIKPVM